MTNVVRISFSGVAPVTLQARRQGGAWAWDNFPEDGKMEYVERVEVFRAEEAFPCLVLEADGDKKSIAVFKEKVFSMQLRLLSPAFADSGRKGVFKFIADLDARIFDGVRDTLWTRFTASEVPDLFAGARSLAQLVSHTAVQALGSQSIAGNDLRPALPFFDYVADPSDYHVELLLRSGASVVDGRRVYLVGFSPRYRYKAKLDLYGVHLDAARAWAEWVQPAESPDRGRSPAVDAQPASWLLWMHDMEAVHDLWNKAVRNPYAASLETVASGEDATFLPLLKASAAGALALGFRFGYESRHSSRIVGRALLRVEPFVTGAGSSLQFQFAGLPLLDGPGLLEYLGHTADAMPDDAEEEVDELFSGWPALAAGGAAPRSTESVRFRIRARNCAASGLAAGDMLRTRFGALDLAVGKDGTLKLDATAYVSGIELGQGPCPDATVHSMSVRVYEMGVADVRPGSEDPLPDATRTALDDKARVRKEERAIRRLLQSPSSLIIPLNTNDERAAAILEAQEQSNETTSRSLIVRLRRTGRKADADRSVVYLSREPFLVAKIRVPTLVQPDSESDEIANWSLSEKEGRKWEIAASSKGFDLLLPPQAVGEAMEKSTSQPCIDAAEPIDYRLSAPAQFRLQSTWFPQGYAEAPWNLSRVLGYPGQRAPGARVDRLAFEMVYGINTVVDAAQVPVRLSLAEVASKIGAMAPLLERVLLDGKGYARSDARRQVFMAYRARWVQMLAMYRSRIAVLELYAPGEKLERSPSEPAQSLFVQEGVTAYLRDGAYKATGTALDTFDRNVGADLRYPIIASRRPPDKYYDEGLAGGFAWPFESHAIFQGLLRDPVSNEARVTGLRFSALGAWGDQRASFDNKRTKIITATAMGRLSRITVERVGRIGVFWNRSKHVIVYERTVLPTRQFEPTQLKLAGRAILRKVAEYVEVLEPERRYPEFGAAPQSRGFVEGINFSSRRILVNGEWGQDGTHGFEIPLWDPQADQRIYPKPSIFLVTSGDKQGVSDRVPREISEPDRLVFFSATSPDLDDRTDLWPSFSGVDYDNHPAPQPEQQEAMDPVDGDAMLPDVVGDLPGWRRFTWPLAEASLATNLVSERAKDAALKATLTNVSMMRSAAGSLALPVPAALGVVDASRTLISQLQQNAAAAARSVGGEALKARLLQELKTARDAMARMSAGAAQASATLIEPLKTGDAAQKARDRVAKELTESIERQQAIAHKRIDEWQQMVAGEINAARAALPAEEYKHSVETWASNLLVGLSPLKSGYETLLGSLDTLIAQLSDQHAVALAAFNRLVWPFEDADMPRELALQMADSARESVHEALAVVANALPVEVPPMLQGALADLRSNLGALGKAADALFDGIEAIIIAAGMTVPALWEEIEVFRGQLFGHLEEPYVAGELTLATPVKLLVRARAELDKAIGSVLGAVPPLARQIIDQLSKLAGGDVGDLTYNLKVACDAARSNLEGFASGALAQLKKQDILKQFVEGPLGWREGIEDLSKRWLDVQKDLDRWRNELEHQAQDTVNQWVKGFEPGLRDAMSGVESFYGRVRSLQDNLGQSPTFQDPTSTLRLIRAVGEGPLLPEMTFNRDRIAYFFDDYAAAVRSSPVAALVNRVGDDLKALGIRLPTQSFLDKVIPDSLQNFDLGKVLPDFSALKNSALFERLKMPAIANDTVKVTQGFDQANRVPWLKASVDVPISERSEAFKLGPLSLILPKANFAAKAEVRVVGGSPQKTQHARIVADWMLEFGGAPLVTFVDTTLEFDEGGGMRFDIRADRIRMDAALQWMTDLMQAFQPDGGSGLKLEMVYDGGRPVGVACTLGVALPPIGAGVFAVSGLMLGAGLTLAVDKESGEFAIGVQFNLSRKINPFTLTIAFLNGGGWVETQARYLTNSRRVISQVSIGIVAGAGVEFALGPCAGSVYVQFGIFVEFASGGEGGQTLSIGVMLLVRGSVVVFSIATVTVTLLLQAVYRQDGSLTGYGSLSVSIRVSQFFKLSFSSQVTYNLSGGGGSRKTISATTTVKVETPGQQAVAAAARQAKLFQ